MSDNLRLFFAIEAPENVKEEAALFLDSLDKNWRPVKKEQIHITLAFMGEVPSSELSKVIGVGDRVASNHSAFQVGVSETSIFPQNGEARVLYAQVKAAKTLSDIANQLRESLIDLADKRTFKPHLTLARARMGVFGRRILKTFSWEWNVESFVLVKSVLSDKSAQHEIIKKFELR